MIYKLLSTFFLSLIFLLVFLHVDRPAQESIGHWYQQTFSHALSCRMTGNFTGINVLNGSLSFTNVKVVPINEHDKSWHWESNHFKMSFSWFRLLTAGTIDMNVALDGVTAYSDFEGKSFAIEKHLACLAQGPELPLPTVIKAIDINDVRMAFRDSNNERDIVSHARLQLRRFDDALKAKVQLYDASLMIKKEIIADRTSGIATFSSDDFQNIKNIKAHIECRTRIPKIDNQDIFLLDGSWHDLSGIFSLYSVNNNLSCDDIVLSFKPDETGTSRWRLAGSGDISLCMVAPYLKLPDLSGTVTVSAQGYIDAPHNIQGSCSAKYITYGLHELAGACSIDWHKRGAELNGTLSLSYGSLITAQGTWFAHEDGMFKSKIAMTHVDPLLLGNRWLINPDQTTISLVRDDKGIINASYTCALEHAIKKNVHMITGNIVQQGDDIRIQGIGLPGPYTICAKTSFPYISSWRLCDDRGELLADGLADLNNPLLFTTMIPFATMRLLVEHYAGIELQGTGTIKGRLRLGDEKCYANITLQDGLIRLPQTYNFINDFTLHAVLDLPRKQVTLHDMICSLRAGTITTSRGLMQFDGTGALSYMHLPLIFDHCLLNVNQDLFGSFSGHMLLSKKQQQQPDLFARMIVDKAQLKENIFSDEWQQQIVQFTHGMVSTQSHNIGCDVQINTKDAIRVDTAFLRTNAHVALSIMGSSQDPCVEGTIVLDGGSLNFPYKPLFISKGEIRFVPGNVRNPLVELVAKNNVKKHALSLQVTGSLLDHHMMLESSPALTEEKIVSLLLVGSYEDTLKSMVPTLLLQNLAHIIFGSNQSTLISRYFNQSQTGINIHFTPSFTDQTGRGGLRGSLEVEVNERLRALLQKNFSLTEDTRFELEYAVSDEVSVRAIRDERRDLGAEVEMRWKW